MKINKEKLNLYRTGKIGLCYYAGYLQELANKIEPFVKEYGYYKRTPGNPDIMTYYTPAEFMPELVYMEAEYFFEKENDTLTGPTVFDDLFTVMSQKDYDQAALIARRMYETCNEDLLLTFKVMRKLIQWAQTSELRDRYTSAALVLTELFLTEFKD